MLAGVGVFFATMLVHDDGDNAYLGLLLVGLSLVLASVPFAVLAVMPRGRVRGYVGLLAFAWLGVTSLLAVVVLLSGIAVIPSQDYPTNDVLVAHLVGAALFLAAVGAVVVANVRGAR